MDSNSNSLDTLPKLEIEDDTEDIYTCGYSRANRLQWNSENTSKLIEIFEKECPELWNANLSNYKDKLARHNKLEYLADTFGTTTEEITRKIHNLRTQLNNEMRKIKKKQNEGLPATSGWEYFDSLTFLKQSTNDSSPDPLDISNAVNIELAEFQVKEEEEFAKARARNAQAAASSSTSPSRAQKPVLMKVAASAPPPPLPLRTQTFMWTEQPRLQPGLNADECQIFGDFVASELRTFRSSESRKKLKRLIQKAILDVGAEEDSLHNGGWLN